MSESEDYRADWIDETDIHTCLCCGQTVTQPGKPITPDRAIRAKRMFDALGFTRDELLTKHRAQLDYQSPGFAAWLEGN
jgi:hypothetical protein